MSQRTQKPIPDISSNLQSVLQQIVDNVVEWLACVGALVMTVEQRNALSVRAYAANMSPDHLEKWQAAVTADVVVYLNNRKHRDNLSVRAIKDIHESPRQYLLSEQLSDLLRPFVSKSAANHLQEELQISQVVAVPFLLDGEVVGSLLAVAQKPFSEQDIDFLASLGHQAASAIQSQRDLTTMMALEQVILTLQSKMMDETEVLQAIVDAMVNELGYAGAIVATLESGHALPVRTYAVDVAPNILQQLEDKVGVSLSGPRAVVYLDDERYKDNLSVRAVQGINGRPEPFLVTSSLYDLLRPIAKKPLADLAQRLVGFKCIIAIPFSLENEIVGNLFVATRKPAFSEREIRTLTTFGRQAAVGLRNARLYGVAEERLEIAQKFGRMAFSATAAVHVLRNHVGVVRNYMHLLQMLPRIPVRQHTEILEDMPSMLDRLTTITDILDNLHQPWQQVPEQPVDANDCLVRALREVFPGVPVEKSYAQIRANERMNIHLSLARDLPMIRTTLDMLTEAFRIIIKNAAEAIQENEPIGEIWVSSCRVLPSMVEVVVRDNGPGIKAQYLSKIFEMGWSTKQGRGMGFGLFWAKDYISGFGGNIKVESTLQKGSTFYIRLPALKESTFS